MDEYFEDHFSWEKQLGIAIKNFINDNGKSYKYDFLKDSINVSFSKDEIDSILFNYDDLFKSTMNHFVSLLVDYIYSREYKECFNDYGSKSVQYMKKSIKSNIFLN